MNFVVVFVGFCLQRTILIVVEYQHQLIFLPLATWFVQCELVAELTPEDCGEEGGAERESYAWQIMGAPGEIQVSLESTERDEPRAPSRGQLGWVAHLQPAIS